MVEADESDASFLYLNPTMSVVTNIDADHMQTYNYDFNKLCQVFVDFLHHCRFMELAIVCIDHPVVRDITAANFDVRLLLMDLVKMLMFRLLIFIRKVLLLNLKSIEGFNDSRFEIHLNLPGKHNVLNALAAIAVATVMQCCEIAAIYSCVTISLKALERRLQRAWRIL